MSCCIEEELRSYFTHRRPGSEILVFQYHILPCLSTGLVCRQEDDTYTSSFRRAPIQYPRVSVLLDNGEIWYSDALHGGGSPTLLLGAEEPLRFRFQER